MSAIFCMDIIVQNRVLTPLVKPVLNDQGSFSDNLLQLTDTVKCAFNFILLLTGNH